MKKIKRIYFLGGLFTESNLVNVAATRAKEEFYIIGDKELVKNLGTKTSKSTVEIIDNNNNNNKNKVFVSK